jgi:hypothetical protein
MVELPAARLFWRHVRCGADYRTCCAQRGLLRSGFFFRRSSFHQPARPKSDFHLRLGRDHHVRRFDIPMHDAGRMAAASAPAICAAKLHRRWQTFGRNQHLEDLPGTYSITR